MTDIISKYALNRNNLIESLIINSFNLKNLSQPKNILEFGAGRGEFINRFLNFPNLRTYAVDADRDYLKILKKKHKAFHNISSLKEKMDFIFLIDVLEHIEDDVKALKSLYEKLNLGGLLLVYVPARPELFSKFDKDVGHFRRYTYSSLKNKTRAAGFSILNLRYHDFLGYFASLYNKVTFTGDLNIKAIKLYDKMFVPASSFIERLIKKPPIGKNLILLAKK